MKERDFSSFQDYRRKSQAMDSQETIKTGHKAKSETEAFINRHLDDRAKGWPTLCPCRSAPPAPGCPNSNRSEKVT
ncbi:MAG: hypothetical protein ACYSYV_04410 [Planctomycetota bacterium]